MLVKFLTCEMSMKTKLHIGIRCKAEVGYYSREKFPGEETVIIGHPLPHSSNRSRHCPIAIISMIVHTLKMLPASAEPLLDKADYDCRKTCGTVDTGAFFLLFRSISMTRDATHTRPTVGPVHHQTCT